MEVLSDILRAMRVEGSVYFCDHLDPPWTKEFPASGSAAFHVIRQGQCWVTIEDRTEFLGTGDLVFLGPGVDHALVSQPPGQEDPPGGVSTLLLCGYCDFVEDMATPVLELIPRTTIVRHEELLRYPWLSGMLNQLGVEYLSQGPGSELIVNKVTEAVLIELIRINFGRKEDSPFLRALADKHISGALQRLHDAPHRHWTLETLANDVGLSRAAFAKRFKNLVGQPMFQYLTLLRMQRARELLRDTSLPVYEIATRIGYESDLAFVRTFKKHTGQTPVKFRNR